MKIKDFIGMYNFHDSFFKSISYNEEKSILVMEIEFAFWMQKNYIEGTPEEGILTIEFQRVTQYSCPNGDPCGSFVGILNTYMNEAGICVFALMDDESNTFFEMQIQAENVSVQ